MPDSKPFLLLIGGLCFHDSDKDNDYRVWMPKYDPCEPHYAVLFARENGFKVSSGTCPTTTVGPNLVSVSLDGCDVEITSSQPGPEVSSHKGELTHSYELPYPPDPGKMRSWSGLDWFIPCRKFLRDPFKPEKERLKNASALVHLRTGTVSTIWPVGKPAYGAKQVVKLWEISVGGQLKAIRAIPNWALAQLPAAPCVLKLRPLSGAGEHCTLTLECEAAIAYLPKNKKEEKKECPHEEAMEEPTKHFKLFDPLLKPHKAVEIKHKGACLELTRELPSDSLAERVSHFLDEIEKLAEPSVILRSPSGTVQIKTAGSGACPPSHEA